MTSTAFSPKVGKTIALGYVRYEHLAAGNKRCGRSGNQRQPSQSCRSYAAVGTRIDGRRTTLEKIASRLDFEQARLAYSIIENLIEHTRIVSDLIAMMAQVLDEDTTKALTQTPTWTAYLDSRRAMEKTKADVEKFAGDVKD